MKPTYCPICFLVFMYDDVVVARVTDAYAAEDGDGPDTEWVHERCAPPSDREEAD